MPTVGQWCRSNLLTVNESKTMWMSFDAKPDLALIDLTVVLNNKQIERVDEFNYLGIILDKGLNFNSQCVKVLKQMRYKIYQLGKIRRFIDERGALSIHKSMILPHYDYGDYIWSHSTYEKMRGFQLLQNKAFRTVYKVRLGPDPLYTTDEMHVKAKCLKLRKCSDIHTIFYAHSLIANPVMTDERILPTRMHRGRRLKFYPIKHPVYGGSYVYMAIQYWNHLKNELTNIEEKAIFKTKIKSDFPNCFTIDNYLVYR